MNKITGSNKVTDRDEATIKTLCNKGVDDRTISEVTGWSVKTVSRIRNGSYHEIKAKMRNYRKECAEAAAPAEIVKKPEEFEQTCIHVGSYDTALGAIIRELAEIKTLLRGRISAE